MNIRLRNAGGAWVVLTAAPAMAQSNAASKPSASVDCKPCSPTTDGTITPPGGPTWLVVVIALVVGMVIGVVIGRRSK